MSDIDTLLDDLSKTAADPRPARGTDESAGFDPAVAAGPASAPTSVQERAAHRARIKEVERLLAVFLKAGKTLRLYDDDHRFFDRFVQEFGERLHKQLATEHALTLEVTPTSINWDGSAVFKNKEQRENLAFKLYRDGVRLLQFRRGIAEEEIREFVGLIAREVEGGKKATRDLSIMFWEAEFKHIHLAVAETFTEFTEDAVETLARLEGDLSRIQNSFQLRDRTQRPLQDYLPMAERGLPEGSVSTGGGASLDSSAVPLDSLDHEQAPQARPVTSPKHVDMTGEHETSNVMDDFLAGDAIGGGGSVSPTDGGIGTMGDGFAGLGGAGLGGGIGDGQGAGAEEGRLSEEGEDGQGPGGTALGSEGYGGKGAGRGYGDGLGEGWSPDGLAEEIFDTDLLAELEGGGSTRKPTGRLWGGSRGGTDASPNGPVEGTGWGTDHGGPASSGYDANLHPDDEIDMPNVPEAALSDSALLQVFEDLHGLENPYASFEDVGCVLAEVVLGVADPEELDPFLAHIDEAVGPLLSTAALGPANSILRRLALLRDAFVTSGDPRGPVLQKFFVHLCLSERLQIIADTLNERWNEEWTGDLFSFISLQDPTSLGELFLFLGKVGHLAPRRIITDALILLSHRRAEVFDEALRSPTWHLCSDAVYALGRIGDARSMDYIIGTFSRPEKQIREEVMTALRPYQSQRITDLMIEALHDELQEVRLAALRYLSVYRIRDAMDALGQFISSPDFGRRKFREQRGWYIALGHVAGDRAFAAFQSKIEPCRASGVMTDESHLALLGMKATRSSHWRAYVEELTQTSKGELAIVARKLLGAKKAGRS